ncbi:unnamed protein product [Brachionus calyciflorus]|uniref:FLYWCH-type domain-containing protein n=1 Tax=Brachionus calyciflorus TaxID=104777 RepID=A0A814BSP6_9BILA|nr:unnamed protein product [Brachionus calyciflorus]
MDAVIDSIDKLSLKNSNKDKKEPSKFKANITLSHKSHPQLHHLGYFFRTSSSNKVGGRINWRFLYKNCKANGYTFCDKVGESCDFFIDNENHRHEQDLVKFELLDRRRLIKERATNSNDKARNILSLLEKPDDNTVRV